MMPPLPQIPNGLIVISPISANSIQSYLGYQFGLSSSATTWPTAKKVCYVPFRLGTPFVVKQGFTRNGLTASGNMDIGIYDSSGTRIVNSGSTAQSGTNAIQVIDIADTLIGPGLFYMALTFDGTTGTCLFVPISNAINGALTGSLEETTGSFGLPATATFVRYAMTSVPIFGFTGNDTL